MFLKDTAMKSFTTRNAKCLEEKIRQLHIFLGRFFKTMQGILYKYLS